MINDIRNAYDDLVKYAEPAFAVVLRNLCDRHQMPEVPNNKIPLHQYRMMPQQSGVYFIWEGLICVYVGKTADLRSRASSHAAGSGKINQYSPYARLSFLPMDNEESDYAELFYIWLLRPEKNLFKEATQRALG